MISLATSWYNTCRKDHTSCAIDTTEASLPARVIDVQSYKDTTTNPLLIAPSPGNTGKYLALSYCWGKSLPLQLTQASLGQFANDGIPLTQMPRALQDAVQLTRSLGLRFLWVDCLGILQDSDEDWQQQFSVMGTTYANVTHSHGASGRVLRIPAWAVRHTSSEKVNHRRASIHCFRWSYRALLGSRVAALRRC